MALCVFEDAVARRFSPLTDTRAVYDLRVGIFTPLEALRHAFAEDGGPPRTLLHARRHVAVVTGQEHDLLTNRLPEGLGVLFVNGRYLPEPGDLLDRLRAARTDGEARAFVQPGPDGDTVVAAFIPDADPRLVEADAVTFDDLPTERVEGARLLHRLWDLLGELRPALERDFAARVGQGIRVFERPDVDVHESAILVEPERIYLAPGVRVRPGAILNAEDGPIYVGGDATIWERAVMRGPQYVGAHAHVKTGANVEGSAFGPWCKVGGEVHTSVVHSYSNKGHEGFLGHSYLGRWCNLGADTNTSNLKNDYGEVSLYDPVEQDFVGTGRQFAGTFMGDHSKCAINTQFNTGTVIGVFCNVFGAGFPPRHLPSFSWGSPHDGFSSYRLDKALRVAKAVMARRDVPLTDADRELLTALAEEAEGAERWA